MSFFNTMAYQKIFVANLMILSASSTINRGMLFQYDPLNLRVIQQNNNLRAVLRSENGPLVLGKRKALLISP